MVQRPADRNRVRPVGIEPVVDEHSLHPQQHDATTMPDRVVESAIAVMLACDESIWQIDVAEPAARVASPEEGSAGAGLVLPIHEHRCVEAGAAKTISSLAEPRVGPGARIDDELVAVRR